MAEAADKPKGPCELSGVCSGNGGWAANCLCAPLVLVANAVSTYCLPCVAIVTERCLGSLVEAACLPCATQCGCWPYVDESFPPEKQLVGMSSAGTTWARAPELAKLEGAEHMQLFQGKIEPADLCQGAVGDCWLVAALACAAEHPETIQRCFVTRFYNPRGIYKMRLFDARNKRWEYITVDDTFPLKNGSLMFMKPNKNELWAILLEKAFAKFCGGYSKLDGGFTHWAWQAITGDHVFMLTQSRREPGQKPWRRFNLAYPDQPEDKRDIRLRYTEESYNDAELWILLKKYDSARSLISASISKSANVRNDGPSGEQMKSDGLVAGHAYSLLQAVEVSTKMLGFGEAKRLVQLRNPWGSWEWKGAWSDGSKEWDEHPRVKSELKPKDDDDGSFWMSFEDFQKTYTTIYVCDRTTSSDLHLDVNEDDGCCGVVKGCVCGCCTYWALCQGPWTLYCGHRSTVNTKDTSTGCCGP